MFIDAGGTLFFVLGLAASTTAETIRKTTSKAAAAAVAAERCVGESGKAQGNVGLQGDTGMEKEKIESTGHGGTNDGET
jgi:hypothetical protein